MSLGLVTSLDPAILSKQFFKQAVHSPSGSLATCFGPLRKAVCFNIPSSLRFVQSFCLCLEYWIAIYKLFICIYFLHKFSFNIAWTVKWPSYLQWPLQAVPVPVPVPTSIVPTYIVSCIYVYRTYVHCILYPRLSYLRTFMMKKDLTRWSLQSG